jgi:hypothetical protein
VECRTPGRWVITTKFLGGYLRSSVDIRKGELLVGITSSGKPEIPLHPSPRRSAQGIMQTPWFAKSRVMEAGLGKA